MEKPKDYNYYANYKKNKISSKDWPQECRNYKRWRSLVRKYPEYKDLSFEETMKIQKERQTEFLRNHVKKMHEKNRNKSPEEKAIINKKKGSYYNNMSEEEKEEFNKVLQQRSQNFWDGLQGKDREDFSKYRWDLRTDESKEEQIKRFIEAGKRYRESLTEEDIRQQVERMVRGHKEKFENDEEFRNKQIALLRKHCEEYWSSLTPDQLLEINMKKKESFAKMSFEKKEEMLDKVYLSTKDAIQPTGTELEFIKYLNKYNIRYEFQYRNKNIHKDFYKIFSHNIKTGSNFVSGKHTWDFILYLRDREILIDIDGSIHANLDTNINEFNNKIEFDDNKRPYQTDGLDAYIVKCHDNKITDDTQVIKLNSKEVYSFKQFIELLDLYNMNKDDIKEMIKLSGV